MPGLARGCICALLQRMSPLWFPGRLGATCRRETPDTAPWLGRAHFWKSYGPWREKLGGARKSEGAMVSGLARG